MCGEGAGLTRMNRPETALAESFAPDRLSTDKAARYAEVAQEIAAVLEG